MLFQFRIHGDALHVLHMLEVSLSPAIQSTAMPSTLPMPLVTTSSLQVWSLLALLMVLRPMSTQYIVSLSVKNKQQIKAGLDGSFLSPYIYRNTYEMQRWIAVTSAASIQITFSYLGIRKKKKNAVKDSPAWKSIPTARDVPDTGTRASDLSDGSRGIPRMPSCTEYSRKEPTPAANTYSKTPVFSPELAFHYMFRIFIKPG